MVHCTPAGKKGRSSSMRFLHRLAVCQRVAGGRELHADAGGGLAVQPRRRGIGLRAELDAATSAGARWSRRRWRAARCCRTAPASRAGPSPPRWRRCLAARCWAGRRWCRRTPARSGRGWPRDVGGREPVEPTSLAGSIQMRMARSVPNSCAWPTPGTRWISGTTLREAIVAQRHRVEHRVVARTGCEEQEVRIRLVDPHALLHHGLRQARRRAPEAVLHVDLRQIGVGAGLEAQRDAAGAVGLADRLHVDQAGRAVHLALDDADDAVLQRLRRGAGVAAEITMDGGATGGYCAPAAA
jgi:hypothetical protein